jgi:hypothetical protein
MKQLVKPILAPLFAVFAVLLLSALACSVDLGLQGKPDEDEFAGQVAATLTAVIATEQSDQTQAALVLPTDTPAPSATLAIPPTETLVPTETNTPTPAGVFVSRIVFAAKMDAQDKPVNPAGQFKKGITKLYASFSYSGFPEGAKVVFRWDNNGKEFSTIARDWSYGESGDFWVNVFWIEGGGLPAGNWKLSIYVDGKLAQSGTCVIYQ